MDASDAQGGSGGGVGLEAGQETGGGGSAGDAREAGAPVDGPVDGTPPAGADGPDVRADSMALPPDLAADLAPDLPLDLPPDRAPDLPIDAPVPVGTGLLGDYYDGSQFELGDTGELEQQVRGDVIDHDWGTGSAHPNMDDDWFSVRWTGKIMPRFSETYTFRTSSDDGIRVWIDDRLVIDHYTPHTAATLSGMVQLQAYYQHKIKVEYFEQTGSAVARLFWSSPLQQPEQPVPRANLFLP